MLYIHKFFYEFLEKSIFNKRIFPKISKRLINKEIICDKT